MILTTSTLLILGGMAFLAAAIFVFCTEWTNMKRRTHVRLKVIDLHPDPGLRGATYLAPEYLVVSGPQAGLRKVSTASSFPPFHGKNALVSGYLDPETNEVHSDVQIRLTGWFIASLAGLGGVMLVIGVQVARVWGGA